MLGRVKNIQYSSCIYIYSAHCCCCCFSVFIIIIISFSFSRCRKSALLTRWLVANRQMIGSRAVYRSRAKYVSESLFECKFMAKYEIMVLACQVGPFHLKFTQINSEMNCIAKNKCPQPEARHETQRWELERHITHLSGATTCIFCAFFVCDLFYVIQEKRQKILLSFWNKVLFWRMFVLLL